MAEQSSGATNPSPMDRAGSNDLSPVGGETTGAAATGDPTETGGLIAPGTGTGMHGRGADLTGAAVPPDVTTGADAQNVLTQVDGTYDANAGGTGATGSTAMPNTLGGVGGSLGGISGGR